MTKSLRAYSCGDSSGITPDSHFNSQKGEKPNSCKSMDYFGKRRGFKKQSGIKARIMMEIVDQNTFLEGFKLAPSEKDYLVVFIMFGNVNQIRKRDVINYVSFSVLTIL